MDRILYPEWRAQQSPTKYPFAERALMTDGAGAVILEGFLLDAALYPVGGRAGLYLTQAVLDHQTATLFIGDAGDPQRCSGAFLLASPPDEIVLTDALGRPAGVLISESRRLAAIHGWGVGTHRFTPEQTEFAATVCMPTPEIGVRGLRLDTGELLSGSVWLVGDNGMVVRPEGLAPAGTGCTGDLVTVVRVDAVGDPLFRRLICDPGGRFTPPNPVRALRILHADGEFLCTPDALGNLRIVAHNALAPDTVLRVRTTPGGIVFEVVGSVP